MWLMINERVSQCFTTKKIDFGLKSAILFWFQAMSSASGTIADFPRFFLSSFRVLPSTSSPSLLSLPSSWLVEFTLVEDSWLDRILFPDLTNGVLYKSNFKKIHLNQNERLKNMIVQIKLRNKVWIYSEKKRNKKATLICKN